ncbi:MAG TPA: ATP-binding protein [Pirellulales bacterium]|jgi:PAS domain S-box-containing protein
MLSFHASSPGTLPFGVRRQAAVANVLLLIIIGLTTATAFWMHGRLARCIEQITLDTRHVAAATEIATASLHYATLAPEVPAQSDPQAENPHTDAQREVARTALIAAIDKYADLDASTRAEAAHWYRLAEEAAAAVPRHLGTTQARHPDTARADFSDDGDGDSPLPYTRGEALSALTSGALAAASHQITAAEANNLAANEQSDRNIWLISIRGVVSFALAAFVLISFAFYLLRRISTLTAAVEQVTLGNTNIALAGPYYDEISGLAQKINEMAIALQSARDRFDLTVRGSSDGTWEWNAETDRIYFSPRFKQLLGYEETETAAFENFLDMIHPDDRDSVYKMVFDHFEHHVPFAIDFRVRHRNGDYQWFHARGQAMWDQLGQATRIAGSVSNVMERYRAEQQLREAKETAEGANRAKSEFLANMSHEIRTPMTAILGFADVIFENGLTSDNAEPLQIIKRNGEHLLEIINDILDLSKIEAGKLQLEEVACSPSQIVIDVASLMRVRADAKALPLSVEFRGPMPAAIRTDPMRLRQILINLVGNAIKFTEVGEIRIVVQVDATEKKQPRLQIEVIDSGIGMRSEQLAKIFQPFAQADSSTTRRFGGTGLGLSISKRLADVLGGTISVRSDPGHGSRFILTVATGPLDSISHIADVQNPLPDAVAASEPRALPANRRCKVLLAEDGPDNQRLIAYVVRKYRADVTIADNGQMAVDLVLAAEDSGDPFHVVLMDMQMPVLDGYGATQKLREAGFAGTIVALTAHAMGGDREKCLAAGCNDYSMKPIDRASLYRVIARCAVPTTAPTDPAESLASA